MPLAVYPKCFLRQLVIDRTMSVEEWVDLVANELDVDGLELHPGFVPTASAARAKLRSRIEGLGLAAPMMCPAPDFVQPDRSRWAEEVSKQCDVIAMTAEMGGQYCRVLSGQWKADVSRTNGLRMAADAISACVEFSVKHGVTLVLENHYKATFWQYPEFAQSKDDFLELLSMIPESENFGVNYDPSNALIAGDDPLELLDAVKSRVRTMHASDRFFEGGDAAALHRLDRHPQQGYAPFLRHGVIGKGSLDYDRIFSVLASIEFEGWISIEDGEDASVGVAHLRESAEFLRLKMAKYGLP